MDGDRGEDFGAAAPKFRLSTAPKPEPATLALGDKSDNRPLYRLHSARGAAQGNQRRRSRAVTKIAPSWEPVIVPSAATAVETVTKVEPEIEVVKAKPFTPTPEEDGPTTPQGQESPEASRKRRRPPGRRRREAKGPSCGAPSTWRPARRRSRSWTPESWRSRAYSRGPGPQPQLSVGEQDDHDGRTGPRFDATAEAPQETSPVLA